MFVDFFTHILHGFEKKPGKSQIPKRKRAVHTICMELEKLMGRLQETTSKNGNNFIPQKTNKVILTNFLPMFLFIYTPLKHQKV